MAGISLYFSGKILSESDLTINSCHL